MSGICERGLMLMLKKIGILGALSELLEPHLFGRTVALKFGTIGVHPGFLLVSLGDEFASSVGCFLKTTNYACSKSSFKKIATYCFIRYSLLVM